MVYRVHFFTFLVSLAGRKAKIGVYRPKFFGEIFAFTDLKSARFLQKKGPFFEAISVKGPKNWRFLPFFKMPQKSSFGKNGPKLGPRGPQIASKTRFCHFRVFLWYFMSQNTKMPQKVIFGFFLSTFLLTVPQKSSFFVNFSLNQNGFEKIKIYKKKLSFRRVRAGAPASARARAKFRKFAKFRHPFLIYTQKSRFGSKSRVCEVSRNCAILSNFV